MTNSDEPFEIEQRGAAAGLNPMFGEWRQKFLFAPVPYRDGGSKLKEFREAIQASLTNQFVFSGEIQMTITLLLDVQTVLETSETADVDNYAKAILDALKGPNGIMIDDTQVQALTISWIDSHETHFDIEVRASPDDFLLKPFKLYEMPDGLFYPHVTRSWDAAEAIDVPEQGMWCGLLATQAVTGAQKKARHLFRKAGHDRLSAYRTGRYIAGQNRGFHKSRAADSGFETVSTSQWKAEYKVWAESNVDAAASIEALAARVRAYMDEFTATISDRPNAEG